MLAEGSVAAMCLGVEEDSVSVGLSAVGLGLWEWHCDAEGVGGSASGQGAHGGVCALGWCVCGWVFVLGLRGVGVESERPACWR